MQNWPYPFERPHSWDVRDEQWYVRYLELKKFKKEQGHCKVPKAWPHNPVLARWVNSQRNKKQRMVSWRKELLDAIDFTWRIAPPLKEPPRTWDQHYQALIEFHQEFGHSNVPKGWSQNKRLSSWVGAQRNAYRKKKLSPDKIQKLESVDFKWVLQVQEVLPWETRYQHLLSFKAEQGHCNVPANYQDKKLARWVARQRKIIAKIPAERKQKLDEIGFVWRLKAKNPSWQMRYQELLQFKSIEGHCNVPRPTKAPWKGLGTWVGEQRRKYREQILTQEQIQQLNQAGFSWEPNKDYWVECYQALVAFKAEHGHVRPSPAQTGIKSLGNWVARQRTIKSQLSKHRIQLLDDLGFEWSVTVGNSPSKRQKEQARHQKTWLVKFEQLKKYKSQQKHTNVSTHDQDYPGLGSWVNKQRIYFKQKTLPQERIDLLNSIGFEWSRAGKRAKYKKK